MKQNILFISLAFLFSCSFMGIQQREFYNENQNSAPAFVYDSSYIAAHFDFPVGPPNAKGYYNAQGFGKNTHLGDDWNGLGGGNTDLGDTIYAIADGYVNFAEDIYGGWGNVVRIVHLLPKGKSYPAVESVYAHMDKIFTHPGIYVRRGEPIGTIGNNHGVYAAHLHLEIRHIIDLPIGGGYSMDTTGYLNPTKFIKNNR